MPTGNKALQRDSVLRSASEVRTEGQTTARKRRATRGRPAAAEPRSSTTIWIAQQEFDWMDDRIREARQSGWRGLNRSALIRALIRVAKRARIDVSDVSSEEELFQALESQLLP